MQESVLNFRSTAYLKMIKADIWVPPPIMVSAIQNWLTSVYSAQVYAQTHYLMTLEVDVLKEGQDIMVQINALSQSLSSDLEAMQLDETKSYKINMLYNDKFMWHENTTFAIKKMDLDSFNLLINADSDILFSNPLVSKGETIDEVTSVLKDVLSKIKAYSSKTPIVGLKILLDTAKKLAGGKSFTNSIVKTEVPVELENWPYVDRVSINNKKYLTKLFDSNQQQKSKLLNDLDTVVYPGHSIGPYVFKTASNKDVTIASIAMSSDRKFYITMKSGYKLAIENKATLIEALDKWFISPIDNYLELPNDSSTLNGFVQKEYPNNSTIKLTYEGISTEEYSGLWQGATFSLFVRPMILNPAQTALEKGIEPMDVFNMSLDDMSSTVRHEMQHFAQTIASLLMSGRFEPSYGLPSAKSDPFEKKYTSDGVSKEQNQNRPLESHESVVDVSYGKDPNAQKTIILDHPLRDIEYQTRLTDDIHNFKGLLRTIPKTLINRAVKVWTGEINEPLFPFASAKDWKEYSVQKGVDGDGLQAALNFINENNLAFKNIKNHLSNKLGLTQNAPVDPEGYTKEFGIMQKTNVFIKPSIFFLTLKNVKNRSKGVSSSRWGEAVSSFVKEVLQ